jgi:ubiquinone/menaquinone biosynthesis C-methylase UbiE
MPKIDNSKFYNLAIQKNGLTSKGVHWNSKYSQYIRFEIIKDFITDIQNQSIVDAGCGFGDFYLFLNKKVSLPKNYIGLDCEEQMVQIATQRTKKVIMKKNIITNTDLPKADYYVCSGAMNILTSDETQKFIKNCFNSSQKGFIFNLLSISDNMNEKVYNHQNPKEILEYCKQFNKNNILKEYYLPNDFTVFMNKIST